ncbi:hypothetical protein K493DRAFT_387341 [Basidiobolus meristosporus CBS 931.73]|uniref:Uncharacterized protein n=1 Tax=Basidiobolus meristosporus CBS 931.73 TaxID=1314790 RepID=A0A1Y1XFW0_9FUNG|nr:hypothetical protein K493DRAFT_387341 [Basidiobolus meristosporus CBS 931.73]|eukprot:ORX84635.1 hypothetical protein K493DRAFT_387341 [Basidiobolus meristosporus CBS 931.73]
MVSGNLLRIARRFKISRRAKFLLKKSNAICTPSLNDNVSVVDSVISETTTLDMFEELRALLTSSKLQRFDDQHIELTPELEFELELARLTGLIEKSALHRLGDQECLMIA